MGVIALNNTGLKTAITLANAYDRKAKLFYVGKSLDQEVDTMGLEVHLIDKIASLLDQEFEEFDAWVFVGAMGICVRSIAPYLRDKHHDPAVVNIDSTGRYAVSVLSGHVGGGNTLTKELASSIGAEAVISTQSDRTGLWALDTLAQEYGWAVHCAGSMNDAIAAFVNQEKTAVLLEIRDRGTTYLESSCPEHVQLCYQVEEIPSDCKLLLAVSHRRIEWQGAMIQYIPRILSLGVGCRKACKPDGVASYIRQAILDAGYRPEAIASISSIELKKDEALLADLQREFTPAELKIFTSEELQGVQIANPSAKVEEVTGSPSVAEASAIRAADEGLLLIEKQKAMLEPDNQFTYALALKQQYLRRGHIEIVGAGPGDPDLISVRGRQFIELADLILYAGSLVPIELTHRAKPGAVVRSSADMNLEEQFALMHEFYQRGLLVVRLHTGDPCIYGAIQEQMAYFDQYGMSYHITPGISSFQAAAAALRSQFTIPEKTQTIILTRGEGRTPMPEKEQLRLLARSRSTMCIFLSASIIDDVQRQLLEEYPADTPVAACYHLTWPDERIYRGKLENLAELVKSNGLTLTTMIVVGDAIDNREGLSRLYADNFKHLFRP